MIIYIVVDLTKTGSADRIIYWLLFNPIHQR